MLPDVVQHGRVSVKIQQAHVHSCDYMDHICLAYMALLVGRALSCYPGPQNDTPPSLTHSGSPLPAEESVEKDPPRTHVV